MFPSTQLVFTKSCHWNFSMSGSSGIGDGGNMGNVNQPPTTEASSTSGSSSAPRPAAKQRLHTGTVLLEFLPRWEVVNLDVDLHLHVLRILLLVLQKHRGLHMQHRHQYLHLNLDLDQHDQQQSFWLYMDLQ